MKKSAKRKTNLKRTPYERDETRTRMRMKKIMGWNIWQETQRGTKRGNRGKRMQNTCYEAHAMRDPWVQTNSGEKPLQTEEPQRQEPRYRSTSPKTPFRISFHLQRLRSMCDVAARQLLHSGHLVKCKPRWPKESVFSLVFRKLSIKQLLITWLDLC